MFDIDPRLQTRLRQTMKRVLIIEENPAYARMLADMLRILGSDTIIVESDDRKAMSLVDDLEPQLILCEYKTAKIDGIGFTKDLRRSGGKCKQVPVIMFKADLTPGQLTDARNAGVHEMMSKPFAWQDLLKRLQNVMTQMAVLVPACKTVKDPRFVNAVSAIVADLRNKAISKQTLTPHVAALAQSLNLDKLDVARAAGDVVILAAEARVAAA